MSRSKNSSHNEKSRFFSLSFASFWSDKVHGGD